MTAWSDTLTLLHQVTSATVMPLAIAALRSIWSDPIPAVMAIWRFGPSRRFPGQVGRPEGLGDDDVSVDEVPVEGRVRAFLVRCDHQGVPGGFKVSAESQLSPDAAEELAWCEVDGRGSGQSRAVGVVVQHGDVISRVRGRVAGHKGPGTARIGSWPWFVFLLGASGDRHATGCAGWGN
jgi:hypothetical protein